MPNPIRMPMDRFEKKGPFDRPMFHIPDLDVSNVKRKYLDIPYASISTSQKLDIFLPETGEGPFPVLVQIHGGGFEFGDKRDIHLKPFLEGIYKGYAVVSINYRLSGEAIFPAAVEDVKAAVRWMRANSAAYHFDSNRIAVCGGSAGGNLAAMIGVTGKTAIFDNPTLGNIEFSSEVQAVVDWFGPMDFLTMDDQLITNEFGHGDHNEPNSPETRYLGSPIKEIPEKVKLANPATYIHPGIPPFFIQHGKDDFLVPYQQSENFAMEIRKKAPEAVVIFELLLNASHGDPKFETTDNMEKVFSFINNYLLNSN
jgi:acetyl esterase/lipase